MTRDEALNMIVASIAMEELALSHILNAEGEKLQYILGTLLGTSPSTRPQDVLAVNKSVTTLVEAVTQNQMLLKNKLDHVLEFFPLPAPESGLSQTPTVPPSLIQIPTPKPPPAPRPDPPHVWLYPSIPPHMHPYPGFHPQSVPSPYPYQKSALQLVGRRARMQWNPDGCLTWRQRSRSGSEICWSRRTPAQIHLNSGRSYVVHYTLSVCAMCATGGIGTIFLRQSPCGEFTEAPPLRFSLEHLICGPQTLCHTAVLHPQMSSGSASELALVLDAPTPLCVEQAVLDIAEL